MKLNYIGVVEYIYESVSLHVNNQGCLTPLWLQRELQNSRTVPLESGSVGAKNGFNNQ